MNCCGSDVLTPFCPQCGKANQDPALELVMYLRKQSAKDRKQGTARMESSNTTREDYAEQYRKQAKTYLDRADKLEEWADLVLALSKLRLGA